MAVTDTAFDTSKQQMPPDLGVIVQMFGQLIGDPRLASMLGDVFRRAFGDALTANATMPGGGQIPYGSTTLFGPQNVGFNLANTLNQMPINDVMGAANANTESVRQQQLAGWFRYFGGGRTENEIDALSRTQFTFTGALHNYLYQQLQPQQLMAGMEEGIRYMGVGGMAGFGDPTTNMQQNMLRTQLRSVTSGLQENYLQNPEGFYGMRGQDVGRIFAELSRTGGFREAIFESNRNVKDFVTQYNEKNKTDLTVSEAMDIRRYGGKLPSELAKSLSGRGIDTEGVDETMAAELRNLTQRTTAITQSAARTIQAFRQLFQGSVTDVLDQINGLMGTDVIQTFDGARGTLTGTSQARTMALQMSATGWVTGNTPQQMVALGGMARGMAEQANIEVWGSVATATLAGQMLGAFRDPSSGTSTEFVNEQRFRRNLVGRVLGAQESGLARDISGAYSLLQGATGQGDAFMQSIRNSPVRDSTDLLQRAQAFAAANGAAGAMAGVTEFSLRNISYTPEAERARMRGIGGLEALRSNAEIIQGSRWMMLQSELESAGLGRGQIEAIHGRLRGGPMTYDAIQRELVGVQGAAAIGGRMIQRFGQQAEALGMGNWAEADNMLRLMSTHGAAASALARVQATVGGTVAFQEMFADRGVMGGILNMSQFIKAWDQGGRPEDQKSLTGFMQAITGKFDTNLTRDDVTRFVRGNEAIIKAIDDDKSNPNYAKRRMGYDAAVSSLLTGQFNGRALTDHETKMMREVVSSPMDQNTMSKLEHIASSMYGTQLLEVESQQFAGDIEKKMRESGNKDWKMPETGIAAISNMVGLRHIANLGVDEIQSKAVSGGSFADNQKFKDIAKDFSTYAEGRMKGGEFDWAKIRDDYAKTGTFRSALGKDTDDKTAEQGMRDFWSRFQSESTINKAVGVGVGVDNSPAGVVIQYLKDILSALMNLGNGSGNNRTGAAVEPKK